MEQVIGINAQGAERELAKFLGIEELIDPSDFATAMVEQAIRRSTRGQGVFHH
jgi:hypothetical protein